MKTKLTLFVLGLFFISTQSFAQHVVRFSPLALVKNKAKIHYEYGGLNKMGLGVIASGYYGGYPGFRVQPYFRYYITDDALQGLYVQPKFHYSMHQYETSITVNGETTKETHDLNEMGGSLNLGWQFIFGSNENIVLDLFTGYRHSNLHTKDYDTAETENDNALGEYAYSLLHSNKFDLGFSLGFKF